MQAKRRQPTTALSPEQSFGKVVQRLRLQLEFSQEELGFESGYHRTFISQLERGQKSPSLRTIFRLATTLKVTASELLRRVEEQMAHPPSPGPSNSLPKNSR